jgi:hypothetical protein
MTNKIEFVVFTNHTERQAGELDNYCCSKVFCQKKKSQQASAVAAAMCCKRTRFGLQPAAQRSNKRCCLLYASFCSAKFSQAVAGLLQPVALRGKCRMAVKARCLNALHDVARLAGMDTGSIWLDNGDTTEQT